MMIKKKTRKKPQRHRGTSFGWTKSQEMAYIKKFGINNPYKVRWYDYIPLEFFSEETKRRKLFDKVIDRAAELTHCNRKATYDSVTGEMTDGPWYYRSSEDLRYYIAKAECDLKLRDEMPWFSPGDNEYG